MVTSLARKYVGLREALVSFENSEKTDHEKSQLYVALVGHQRGIWENGLDDDLFEVLVHILVNTPLGTKFQQQILHCLIPQFRIPKTLSERLFFWFCSQVVPTQGECGYFIKWLELMARFNFLDSEFLDSLSDIILKYMVYPRLAPYICEFLILTVKPKLVTRWNVRLIEMYFDKHKIAGLKSLLRSFAQLAPHLVPKKYHSCRAFRKTKSIADSNFEEAVRIVATKCDLLTETGDTLNQKENWKFIPELPCIEYSEIVEGKKRIEEITSFYELGKFLGNLQLPTNELTLIQNDFGIMSIVINGPSKNFLQCLLVALSDSPSFDLIIRLADLQDILTYGLPPLTHYLSRFLLVWDGLTDSELVYRLLPRLHFNSCEDLLEMVLRPLARVYYVCEADVKVNIIDSLTQLIVNMVCVEMKTSENQRCRSFPPMDWVQEAESAVHFLIEFCIELMVKGFAYEGPQSTVMVLHSIIFYEKITQLILKEDFPYLYVIHQCFSYPALYSMNHVMLNELCKLILTYKKELIPAFEERGLLANYEPQVEAVMALADSAYKYLWEKEGEGRPHDYHTTSEPFSPHISIGINHFGIFPLLVSAARNLNKDPKTVTKQEFIEYAKAFLKNVFEFITYEDQESSNSTTA